MKQYVLGFVFDEVYKRVLLIKKLRPDWQKGNLNGIGGKVEEKETPFEAMIRECQEETSVLTKKEDWSVYCLMDGRSCPDGDWIIHCFYGIAQQMGIPTYEFKQNEEEFVDWHYLDRINSVNTPNLLGNIPWLVTLALDFWKNGNIAPPTFYYTGGFSLPLNI